MTVIAPRSYSTASMAGYHTDRCCPVMDVPGTEEAGGSGGSSGDDGGASDPSSPEGDDGGASEGGASEGGPEGGRDQRRRLLDSRKQHRMRRHRR
jgi:hypothetical protein